MEELKRPWLLPTGIFIRDFLLARKEGYAYEVWKALKEERKRMGLKAPTYRSFWKVWSIIRKLGLIRLVRVEEPLPGAMWWRRYYEVVPGAEVHPAWYAPQKAYNPLTGLGPKYRRLMEEARARRVRTATLFLRKYPDRVTETAARFMVSRAGLVARLRRRRPRRA